MYTVSADFAQRVGSGLARENALDSAFASQGSDASPRGVSRGRSVVITQRDLPYYSQGLSMAPLPVADAPPSYEQAVRMPGLSVNNNTPRINGEAASDAVSQEVAGSRVQSPSLVGAGCSGEDLGKCCCEFAEMSCKVLDCCCSLLAAC